ncbi:MAG: hypothetical protein Ct9H300mP13_2230 [Gammaproteobacteria bacterium]|nr:MAG: hypothetical protein Ct9H300mP13_2230 [Gammaproteobacteria bacterium]
MGRVADGVDDVVKAVREQIHAGCDFIKIMATGGVMTPGVNPEDATIRLRKWLLVSEKRAAFIGTQRAMPRVVTGFSMPCAAALIRLSMVFSWMRCAARR